MTYALTVLLRRLAAVMLLLAVLGALAIFVVIPVVAHVQSLRADIEQERLTLARLASMPDDAVETQSIERMTAKARESRQFLEGESDPIRLANLQSVVGGIAASQGVKLRSSRNLPPRERADVRYVGVQLQFAATVGQLQKILLAIEAQRPFLFIDTVHVTPMPGALAAGGEDGGQLDSRIEILGATPHQKG